MELSKVYAEQKEHMEKCIAALKRDFMTIRSGKVSISILDNIHVDYYGTPTGLSQVATVLATDATTITISPWEKKCLERLKKQSCKQTSVLTQTTMAKLSNFSSLR